MATISKQIVLIAAILLQLARAEADVVQVPKRILGAAPALLDISPDGSRLSAVVYEYSEPYSVLWDLPTGRQFRVLGGAYFFSPVANQMIGTQLNPMTIPPRGRLVVYDLATARVVRTFDELRMGQQVFYPGGKAALLPDGSRILASCEPNSAVLFDAASADVLQVFRYMSGVTLPAASVVGVAISPNGDLAVTGTASSFFQRIDPNAHLWDTASGAELRLFAGHQLSVPHVAFSSDASLTLTGSEDGTAKLWETSTGNLIHTFPHTIPLSSIAISSSGARVLTAANDGVKLWHAVTGARLHTFPIGDVTSGGLPSAIFSPDDRSIITHGSTPITIWDSTTFQPLRNIGGHPMGRDVAMAVSPDGRYVATCIYSEPQRIAVWDPQTAEELNTFIARCDSMQFSPDGTQLLTMSDEGVAFWNPLSGAQIDRIEWNDSLRLIGARFFPDGKKLWLIGGTPGGLPNPQALLVQFHVWDIAARAELRRFPAEWIVTVPDLCGLFSPFHQPPLDVSADLRTGVALGRLWDLTTGTEIRPLSDNPRGCSVFSPDGRYVAASSGTAVDSFDVVSGNHLQQYVPAPAVPTTVAFSPDGGRLVTSGIMYDTLSGIELRRFGADYALGGLFISGSREVLTSALSSAGMIWDADPPIADLESTVELSPSAVATGSEFEISVRVVNNGPDLASGIRLQFPLPDQVEFAGTPSTGASCTGDRIIRCTLPDLSPGNSLTVRLAMLAVAPGSVRQEFTAISNPPDVSPSNNSASVEYSIGPVSAMLLMDIDEDDASLVVSDLSNFPPIGRVRVDNERMHFEGTEPVAEIVLNPADSTPGLLVNIQRGIEDTVPEPHLAGSVVELVRACPGDCTGYGSVTLGDLLVGVGIALGNVSIDECFLLDRDRDSSATIIELTAAVRSHLIGCPEE